MVLLQSNKYLVPCMNVPSLLKRITMESLKIELLIVRVLVAVGSCLGDGMIQYGPKSLAPLTEALYYFLSE